MRRQSSPMVDPRLPFPYPRPGRTVANDRVHIARLRSDSPNVHLDHVRSFPRSARSERGPRTDAPGPATATFAGTGVLAARQNTGHGRADGLWQLPPLSRTSGRAETEARPSSLMRPATVGLPSALGSQPLARARRTSGGVASSASWATSASRPITSCAWLPKRRTETVRSAASFLPTARITGIFCSECSRTL